MIKNKIKVELTKLSPQPGAPIVSIHYRIYSEVVSDWVPFSICLTSPIDVNDKNWRLIIDTISEYMPDYQTAVSAKNQIRALALEALQQ